MFLLYTYINKAREVPLADVVQHGGFVQAGELSHVLHLAELGRVHLLDVILVDCHLLAIVSQHHQHLVAVLLLDTGRLKAMFLRWDPHQLLGRPVSLSHGAVQEVFVDKEELLVLGWGLRGHLGVRWRANCWNEAIN